jgi:hypothetical protein
VPLNAPALAIVLKPRGMHATHVFSYLGKPITQVSSNSASYLGEVGMCRAARHSLLCRSWVDGHRPRWCDGIRTFRPITWLHHAERLGRLAAAIGAQALGQESRHTQRHGGPEQLLLSSRDRVARRPPLDSQPDVVVVRSEQRATAFAVPLLVAHQTLCRFTAQLRHSYLMLNRDN